MPRLSNDRLLRLRWRAERWPRRPGTIYFQSGREALLALLRSMPDGGSKVILLPSYVPEGLYAPAMAAGWQVKMYPIGANLVPDWDALATLMANCRPELAVIIHYFGISQDATRFAEICRANDVLSIEDLAHVAPRSDSSFGTAADLALTSLPKMFGTTDGAGLSVLSSRAAGLKPCHDQPRSRLSYVVAQAGVLLLSTIATLLPPVAATFVSKVSGRLFRPYQILMDGFVTVRPMSGLSYFLLRHTDWRFEIDRRIELARLYAEHLDRDAFGRLVSIPSADHGMFGYPVMVTDRQSLIDYLTKKGISGTILANGWDFRQEAGYTIEDGTEKVLAHHFILPVAGRLSNSDVMQIIDAANAWAGLSR